MKPRLPLLLAATTAVAVAGCGSSSSSSSSTTPAATTAPTTASASTPAATPAKSGAITVKLTEWAVTPSATTAKAGKVTFDAVNDGQVAHELVVLKTSKAADKLGSGSRIPETGHVGEAGDVPVGASKTFSIKLKPGHYSLVCNLPGHYMSGMHADFTVQ